MKIQSSLLIAVFLVSAVSSGRAAEVLETSRFKIVIEHLCEEGCVSCDQIRYTGTSKTTKRSITLMGETVHTLDDDGVTPNKFLGYRFVSGSTEYFVHWDGTLVVSQKGKTLLEEKGKWVSPQ